MGPEGGGGGSLHPGAPRPLPGVGPRRGDPEANVSVVAEAHLVHGQLDSVDRERPLTEVGEHV